MRRMAFSATVDQMRAGTKTVTRRSPDTWANLRPGDRLLAIEQGMGLPKGARQVPIRVIEIVSSTVVAIEDGDNEEAQREGFGSWPEFIDTWTRLHGRPNPCERVRRIEFRHIYEETP